MVRGLKKVAKGLEKASKTHAKQAKIVKKHIKKMGKRKMGRHWSSEEEWAISTMRKTEGEQKKVSKMRPTCKSHTDDKVAKGECCQTKESCR